MAEFKLYRCSKCGSVVAKLNVGGCSPSCCGAPMDELTANTTDGAFEKHVPEVAVEGNAVRVQVGATIHPMMDAHYIQWIALETTQGVQIATLKPGAEPKATFTADGDPIAAYEYCNLHGLWKKEL